MAVLTSECSGFMRIPNFFPSKSDGRRVLKYSHWEKELKIRWFE